MKKVLIGCGVVSLLLVIGLGLAAYFWVFKPAAQVAGEVIGSAREVVAQAGTVARTLDTMRALEAEVRAQGPYTPPADGALTAAQVERFLAVHGALMTRLGPERERLAQAVEAAPGSGGLAEIGARVAALASLGDLALAAKRAQVDALNAQGLSLAEYQWIRQTGIAALLAGGVQLAVGAGGERMAELIRQAQQAAETAEGLARQLPDVLRPPGAAPGPAPADEGAGAPAPAAAPTPTPVQRANFELVRAHSEAFAQSQLFALVGL